MFYKNFKQIARSLWLHKNFTSINLLGLSVGVAAVTIIFLIIKYERGFDRFHSDSENIYRIVSERERSGKVSHHATVPYPTAQLLRAEYPGILATQVHYSEDMDVRIENIHVFYTKISFLMILYFLKCWTLA